MTDENLMDRAAALLVAARQEGRRLPELPPELRPQTVADAYAIQKKVLDAVGGSTAWKVGAKSPEAEPNFARLPQNLVATAPCSLSHRMFGAEYLVEVEIAFRFAHSLPPRPLGYGADEVLEAVDAAMVAIEVVDSRFEDFRQVDRLSQLADHQNNGYFVYGEPVTDWRKLDIVSPFARLVVNGRAVRAMTGANPAGDPLWLLAAVANHASSRGTGLPAGTIVTTGSLTGMTPCRGPANIVAMVDGFGTALLTLT